MQQSPMDQWVPKDRADSRWCLLGVPRGFGDFLGLPTQHFLPRSSSSRSISPEARVRGVPLQGPLLLRCDIAQPLLPRRTYFGTELVRFLLDPTRRPSACPDGHDVAEGHVVNPLQIRLSRRLYDEMQSDLRRRHPFAGERVGFAYGRLANAASAWPLILLTRLRRA